MSTFPPPSPSSGPSAAPAYAGFRARLGAFVLDGLLHMAFLLPAAALLVVSVARGRDRPCSVGSVVDGRATGVCHTPNEGVLVVGFVAFFVGFILYAWFVSTRLGRTGQTPGRRVMGTRVVDQHTGEPIGVRRALVRYLLAGTVSAWFCWLGHLWMLWDGRRQTWHDKLVGSIVVRA